MAALSTAQVQALIAAAPNQTMRALFAVAATAGPRRGELLGLCWPDVDFDRDRLTIARTAQRIKGKGVVYGEPKTNAGRRRIRLGTLALEELRKLQEWQSSVRNNVGQDWNPGDVVFASAMGTPIEESTVTRCFKASCVKAGIGNIRFHDLRHTAATVLMENGVPARVVQEMLGHANVAITLGIYSHVTPDMQEAAAAAIDAAYG
jgi:integrase